MAGLGALLHWAPKLWGVVVPEGKALPLVGASLIGAVLAGAGNLLAGFSDQPTGAVDAFDYDGPRALWNLVVAAGHALFALGLVGVALAVVSALRSGAKAADDPWNGHTLEWAIPSPAPRDNFAALATVGSAEPVLDAKPSKEASA
jgi:heme/copper-type cytochrome/quinol oxidase subunit 1